MLPIRHRGNSICCSTGYREGAEAGTTYRNWTA